MNWKRVVFSLGVVLAPVAPAAPDSAAPAASTTPTPPAFENITNTIPIFTFFGMPDSFISEKRYREMADAGITLCFPGGRGTPAIVKANLDAAANTGVKIVALDSRVDTDPKAVANDYKSCPALGAYFVADEPAKNKFPRLGEIVKALNEADPAHAVYINLFPTYATGQQLNAPGYGDYLASFVSMVRPNFLSFDNYAINDGGRSLGSDYFLNLQMVAASARAHHIPFWAFADTVVFGSHPILTEAQLRFQVFNNLAYGARGIEYFTYWTPPAEDGLVFSHAPIEQDGKRTSTYDVIKKINPEIKALTPALVKLTSVDVFHSTPLPPGTQALPKQSSPEIPVAQMEGQAVTLGVFRDEEEPVWIMVVNRSFTHTATVTLTLKDAIRGLTEISKQTGRPEPLAVDSSVHPLKVRIDLAAGDGRLFQLATTP